MTVGRSVTDQESFEKRGRQSPIGTDETDDQAGKWRATRSDVEHQVGRKRLKSVIARVTQRPEERGKFPVKAYGAAWGDGTPIKKVQVKVDDGKWKDAVIDKEPSEKYCWKFFSIDLGSYPSGKHSLVSRAIDANGRIQPSSDDDEIALKKTYWEANQQWVREVEIGD